jgi:hypothetical protein
MRAGDSKRNSQPHGWLIRPVRTIAVAWQVVGRIGQSISRSHQEYVVAWRMAQRYLHLNESVVANLQ